MGWLKRRKEKKEFDAFIDAMYEAVVKHVESGGTLESLLVTPLFETVEWDKEKQSWAVEVLDGGASWENGLDVTEKFRAGQRVSLLSGRGGRMEDAVVVSGRKVTVGGSAGYRYLLDFTETGGAEPWFKSFMQ